MGTRILMIEDEPDFAALAEKILASEGYELEHAPTLAAARALLREGRPDLVLLDLHLPDGDGLDLLRELRAERATADVPCLIFSVRKGEEDVVDGLGLGADDYLVKSFSPEGLRARVGALLRRAGHGLAALLLGCALAGPACAGPAEDAAERLGRELTAALQTELGAGRAHVVVSVEGKVVSAHNRVESGAAAAAPGARWAWDDAQGRSILPGYKEAASAGAAPAATRVRTSVEGPDFHVTRQRIFVILDDGVDPASADALRLMLEEMVGFDVQRGDELKIYRRDLVSRWGEALASGSFFKLAFTLGVLALLFGAGAAATFFGLRELGRDLAARLPRPGPGAAPPAVPARDDAQPVALELEPDAGGPLGLPGPGLEAGGAGWGFLAEASAEEAAEAFAPEDPADAALALGELAGRDLATATRLFGAMEAARQLEIAAELAPRREKDPQKLYEIEERLRARLERRLHGARSLGELISRLAPERREWLLTEVAKRAPEAARGIEREMLTFEHLADLPGEILDALVRGVDDAAWAAALRGMPPAFTDAVLARFPEKRRRDVAAVLSGPVDPEAVFAARADILARAQAAGARRRG